MIKKITFFTSLLFFVTGAYSQKVNQEPTNEPSKSKIRYFEFGIGIPNIYLRDKTSSSLAYEGTGLAAIHFAGSKQNSNQKYREWNINVQVQNAKPDIVGVSNWNKPASIYSFDMMYRKLKGIKPKTNAKWNFFAGVSLGSNLQLAIIPTSNNSFAYNFSWLQAGLEGMIRRDFVFKDKKLQFTNQTSLPIFGVNARPLSYVGLISDEVIWSQESEFSASFYRNLRLFSLQNNLVLKNELSLYLLLRKSKLGLRYSWQYQYNTVSVNSLNSINSSISVNYAIQLKNK